MPTPFDLANSVANTVGNVLSDIGDTAVDLTEDGVALAQSLGSGFSDAVDASADEWEEFVDGLSDQQSEVLAQLSVFMEKANELAGNLVASRDVLVSGNFAQISPEQLGGLVRDGWPLVGAGAELLANLMLAFPDEDGIQSAIAQTSPLLTKRLGLEPN